MSSDPILARLQAVLEEARREAYERGYADAIRRVASMAAELPARGPGAFERPHVQAAAAYDAEQDGNGLQRRTRAPRGSVERRVLTLLQAAPAGLTVPEIETLASAGDEPIKAASIRVVLQRLLAAGQVGRDGRRWLVPGAAIDVPVAPEEPGEDEEAVFGQAPD
jgi:hypothetical protein